MTITDEHEDPGVDETPGFLFGQGHDVTSLERSLSDLATWAPAPPITKTASPQLLHAIRLFLKGAGVEAASGEQVLATE